MRTVVGLMLVLTALTATACSDPEPAPTATAGSGTRAGPASGSWTAVSLSPGGTGTTGSGADAVPATDRCARTALARLTDRQRVGQLFVAGVPASGPADEAIQAVVDTDAGGYLLFGGTDAGVGAVRRLTDRITAQLLRRSAGVAPLVAADHEGGQVQALTGTGFSTVPSALVQGRWPVPRLRAASTGWAGELRRAGVNLDFAPVLDVVPAALGTRNGPIGRYDREFGHTPDVVAEHGSAMVAGLQNGGVAATAKHFPGLGRVIGNTDDSAGVADAQTSADDAALAPFRAAVTAGTRFVMVSSARYPRIDPSHRAVFSASVMTVLRDGLGFTGVIVSDDLGSAAQVADVPVERRARDFLAAGGQLVVVVKPPGALIRMAAAVLAAREHDAAFRSTVDAAALAVLTAKARMGLISC